jgi:hypothetical protein
MGIEWDKDGEDADRVGQTPSGPDTKKKLDKKG